MQPRTDPRPLIAHVVYRFDVGGLENGVVNLINRLPHDRWRHAVVALSDVSPDFSRRVERSDVEYLALRKPGGHLVGLYPRLTRIFRAMKPAIVHTRNTAALEATVPAWLKARASPSFTRRCKAKPPSSQQSKLPPGRRAWQAACRSASRLPWYSWWQ